jgi:hypothetical protein
MQQGMQGIEAAPVLYFSFTNLPSARSSSVFRSPRGSTCRQGPPTWAGRQAGRQGRALLVR